jgi:hypothetical protein
MSWFTADKDGLRQIHERLVERRGFGIICGELYQNVMDTSAKNCKFILEKIPNAPRMRIVVEDDGEGFQDLSHAWTMFAPSLKKHDPTKGGRFNLGEKVVLSFALSARISTTSGTVEFDENGRKEYPRKKREIGTVVEAELRCNEQRFQECLEYMRKILVRPGLTLTVNNEIILPRTPFLTFSEKLPTEIGDDLRPSIRTATIEIYEAQGETAMLYELGIPVVETNDKWHYNVLQKVPLNVDRDNVTPRYLKTVRTLVYNNTYNRVQGDDVVEAWVNEATSDPRCISDGAEHFLKQKFGENVVASTPGKRESDCAAVAKNYTVVAPRGLTKGQRENLKGILKSSHEVFPIYSDEVADDVKYFKENELTPGMLEIREYTQGLGKLLLGKHITVCFFHSVKSACSATYKSGTISFNLFYLGEKWFENGVTIAVDDLILHELAHDIESNHLDSNYHGALSNLGAKLKHYAMKDPKWFGKFVR